MHQPRIYGLAASATGRLKHGDLWRAQWAREAREVIFTS